MGARIGKASSGITVPVKKGNQLTRMRILLIEIDFFDSILFEAPIYILNQQHNIPGGHILDWHLREFSLEFGNGRI
ncbi:hypothetical protein D3C78_1558110 [compost metagenome]